MLFFSGLRVPVPERLACNPRISSTPTVPLGKLAWIHIPSGVGHRFAKIFARVLWRVTSYHRSESCMAYGTETAWARTTAITFDHMLSRRKSMESAAARTTNR